MKILQPCRALIEPNPSSYLRPKRALSPPAEAAGVPNRLVDFVKDSDDPLGTPQLLSGKPFCTLGLQAPSQA
jgi:hypothetical protein